MTDLKPELPYQLGRILRHCLEKDPGRRFQSALDVRNELGDLRKEIESGERIAARNPVLGQGTWKWVGLAGGISLLLLLVLAFLARQPTDKPVPQVERHEYPDRKMIGVFPFENLGRPEDEYFAAGMAEEITSRLAAVQHLGVISRTSAVQYDRAGKNTRQIALRCSRQALESLQSQVEGHSQDPSLRAGLGLAYACLGDPDQAVLEARLAADLMPISRDAVAGPYFLMVLAYVYLLVGEPEAALEQLDQILSVPGLYTVARLRIDPYLAPLKEHPRFRQLMDRHR